MVQIMSTFGPPTADAAIRQALQNAAVEPRPVQGGDLALHGSMRAFLTSLGRADTHGQPMDVALRPTGRHHPLEIPAAVDDLDAEATFRIRDRLGVPGFAMTGAELKRIADRAMLHVDTSGLLQVVGCACGLPSAAHRMHLAGGRNPAFGGLPALPRRQPARKLDVPPQVRGRVRLQPAHRRGGRGLPALRRDRLRVAHGTGPTRPGPPPTTTMRDPPALWRSVRWGGTSAPQRARTDDGVCVRACGGRTAVPAQVHRRSDGHAPRKLGVDRLQPDAPRVATHPVLFPAGGGGRARVGRTAPGPVGRGSRPTSTCGTTWAAGGIEEVTRLHALALVDVLRESRFRGAFHAVILTIPVGDWDVYLRCCDAFRSAPTPVGIPVTLAYGYDADSVARQFSSAAGPPGLVPGLLFPTDVCAVRCGYIGMYCRGVGWPADQPTSPPGIRT